jgi:hypothetical protein
MKLNPKTVEMLKNFSTINQSIYIKPGNIIKTIAANKALIARAEIPDTFERPFGIYNLSQFLSCLSVCDDPELEFDDDLVHIKDNKNPVSFDYYYCDPNVILVPPEKELVLPSVDLEFSLNGGELNRALKAMAILELNEIAVIGDGNSLILEVLNGKTTNQSTKTSVYRVELGSTHKNFRAVFKGENLKMMNADFDVILCAKGISKFTASDITYYVTVEANSSYWN